MRRRSDDAEPPPEEAPRLFTAWFWIALAFGVLCVAAAIGVDLAGPHLFAHPAATAS